MRTYIIKRLLLMIPVMLGVTLITFVLIQVAPGDVVDVIYEDANVSLEELGEIRHDLGYDRNIMVQYGD
jgi:peptide/nickel transport system permease protein